MKINSIKTVMYSQNLSIGVLINLFNHIICKNRTIFNKKKIITIKNIIIKKKIKKSYILQNILLIYTKIFRTFKQQIQLKIKSIVRKCIVINLIFIKQNCRNHFLLFSTFIIKKNLRFNYLFQDINNLIGINMNISLMILNIQSKYFMIK